MVRLFLRLLMAVCVLIGAVCPFGFWAAFEPGQEKYLIIYPAVFVAATVVGTIAERFARLVGNREHSAHNRKTNQN